MWYKYTGPTPKTVYGVTFNPGDIKEVCGVLNKSKFILVDRITSSPNVIGTKVDLPAAPVERRVRAKKVSNVPKEDTAEISATVITDGAETDEIVKQEGPESGSDNDQ